MNLKGLICTLLHRPYRRPPLSQIISSAETGSYRDKENDIDWPVRELRPLYMSTLASYLFAACIFPDGLDEICENNVQHLLEIVENARALPKICVPSRLRVVF